MGAGKYPEWFIGGPLHGEDRAQRPDLHRVGDAVRIEDWTCPEPDRHVYVSRRFAIGETTLTIWVLAGLGEMEAATLLAGILLKPHERQAATT